MTVELNYRRKKKSFVPFVDNDQLQLDWIKGLVEQIEFANRPDVLPDYYLKLKVSKRRMEP